MLLSENSYDFIIIGDVDEIPNLKNFDFEKTKDEIIIFKQKMFYYKLNLEFPNFTWMGSKICKIKNLISRLIIKIRLRFKD